MGIEFGAKFNGRMTAVKNTLTEIKNLDSRAKKKLFFSAVLGGAILAANWGSLPITIKELTLIKDLIPVNFNNWLAFGLVPVDFGVSYLGYRKSKKLLQNEQIKLSPDFWATAIYYGIGKSSSEEQKSRIAASLPAITTFLITESGFFAVSALSPLGVGLFIVQKTGQITLSLAQSGIEEIFLQTVGKEKNKKESLPTKGLIFGHIKRKM